MMARDTGSTPGLAEATRLLEERLAPAAILLFGSQASGAARSGSDFDLAVLLDRGACDAFRRSALATEIEDTLRHRVDLVILNDASPIVAMEVLRAHRPLAVRDPEALESFTVRTVLMYDDLKRIRAPIEQALLRERGS